MPGEEAFGLSGVIYENNGEAPAEGAYVKLIKGNQVIDMVVTDSSGAYGFICDPGIYNLVVEHNGLTKTSFVEVSTTTVKNLTFDAGKTESVLNVNSDLEVIVGGLDAEAEAIRAAEGVSGDKNVTVSMNVEEKSAETAKDGDKIVASDSTKTYDEFIDVSVEKSVDGVVSALDETNGVIEIVVPYANINKREVVVYSYHDDEVVTFTESDTKADGTFILDKENGVVRIYTSRFSTFAIAYTPYFNLSTSVSLGSYEGKVSATLTNVDTGEVVTTLNDVALDQISFHDLKKGEYLLTITWVDGASNTITMPITIG